MDQEMEQVRKDVTDRDGIRHVLLVQYALHEANHHPELGGGATANVPTVPKAHTLADVYKCLHQGHFGVGHSIDDPVRFANQLELDLLRAESNSTEPILETVSSADLVFRVNLRPFRREFAGRHELASHLLADVCLNSAARRRRSKKDFMASLEWFRDLNSSGELTVQGRSYMFPSKSANHFVKQVAEFIYTFGNVPVLSHSAVYKEHNAPSYRVVDREALESSPLASLLQEMQ
jgi:hypothetical protein